jgi:hypothetical protein
LSNELKIIIDLARSPHVVLDDESSIKLLDCIVKKHGVTRDLEEAMRIVRNFEEFYRYSRKRFEEYLAPPKDQRDVITGRVVVQKLRLLKKNSEKLVEFIFDRRYDLEELINCLKELGFENISIERQSL